MDVNYEECHCRKMVYEYVIAILYNCYLRGFYLLPAFLGYQVPKTKHFSHMVDYDQKSETETHTPYTWTTHLISLIQA